MKNSHILLDKKKLKLDGKISFDLLPITNDIESNENPQIINLTNDCTKPNLLQDDPSNKKNSERLNHLEKTIKSTHLSDKEKDELFKLINKHSEIFFIKELNDHLPGTHLIEHSINLKIDKPTFVRQYRTPEHLREILNKKINELIQNDIVEPCNSSDFNSPVFLVEKKKINGVSDYRLVVNYQKLNENIVQDRFPIPNAEDILKSFHNKKYFSTIDLYSSYYQVPIRKQDRHKTSFAVQNMQLQFTRTPMGLVDSGCSLQRLLNNLIHDLSGSAYVYVDDFICATDSIEEHLSLLNTIFNRLADANLKISPNKCEFLKGEINFLGSLISTEGTKINESNIQSLRDAKPPENVKGVRSFLGLANYFRGFIKDFATISHPLNKLLKKNTKFVWTTEAQTAFDIMKQKLISPPVLAHPNFSDPNALMIVRSDASNYAIGATLSQLDSDGVEHIIGYASKSLNKSQENYSTFDREALALVWSISEQFRAFLMGRPFLAVIDHLPLIGIISNRFDSGSPRLIRWKLKLAEFNFKLIYQKGHNNISDYLSRLTTCPEKAIIINNSHDDETPSEMKEHKIKVLIVTRSGLKTAVNNDNTLSYLKFVKEISDKPNIKLSKTITESNKKIDFTQKDALKICFISEDLSELDPLLKPLFIQKGIKSGQILEHDNILAIIFQISTHSHTDEKDFFNLLLKLKEQISIKNEKNLHFQAIKTFSIPHFLIAQMISFIFRNEKRKITIFIETITEIDDDDEKEKLVNLFHSNILSGHRGINSTLSRLKKLYHWPHMDKLVSKIITNCRECQLHKHPKRHQNIPLRETSSSTKPWEKLSIDVVGPINPTSDQGNRYILTVYDDLTKYLIAIPIPDQTADTVAQAFVKNVILIYSSPVILLSDLGSCFISELFKAMCKIFNIKKTFTTPYRPQSSNIEAAHKSLGNYLRINCERNKTGWDYLVPFYCFSYNTAIHSSTQYSPYELLFGREANLPFQNATEVDKLYNYDDYVLFLKSTLQKIAIDAREFAIRQKEVRKKFFDRKAIAWSPQIGSLVKLKSNKSKIKSKLDPIYSGPFKIIESDGETLSVLINNKVKKMHKNHFQPYNEQGMNDSEIDEDSD